MQKHEPHPYTLQQIELVGEDFMSEMLGLKLGVSSERQREIVDINRYVTGQFCASEKCWKHKDHLPKLMGQMPGGVTIGEHVVECLNQVVPTTTRELFFTLFTSTTYFMGEALQDFKQYVASNLLNKPEKTPEQALSELLSELPHQRDEKTQHHVSDMWEFQPDHVFPWMSYGISEERFTEISQGVAHIYHAHIDTKTETQKLVGLCYEHVPVNGPGEMNYRAFAVGVLFMKHVAYKDARAAIVGK